MTQSLLRHDNSKGVTESSAYRDESWGDCRRQAEILQPWRAVADRSRHERQQPEKPGRRRLTAEFGGQMAGEVSRNEEGLRLRGVTGYCYHPCVVWRVKCTEREVLYRSVCVEVAVMTSSRWTSHTQWDWTRHVPAALVTWRVTSSRRLAFLQKCVCVRVCVEVAVMTSSWWTSHTQWEWTRHVPAALVTWRVTSSRSLARWPALLAVMMMTWGRWRTHLLSVRDMTSTSTTVECWFHTDISLNRSAPLRIHLLTSLNRSAPLRIHLLTAVGRWECLCTAPINRLSRQRQSQRCVKCV